MQKDQGENAAEPRVAVRAMGAEDVEAVLDIQSCCYDDPKQESRQSFLTKLNASPRTCFVALLGGVPAGYLVAVPAEAGKPPPLNGATYRVPRAANALYLHDLSVRPEARGSGTATALVAAYFEVLKQSQAEFGCLTAVNESSSYWERYGFRREALADAVSGQVRTYGEGAQYMSIRLRV